MEKETGLLRNLMWKFAERFSAQLISALVSIVLARLLEPDFYGDGYEILTPVLRVLGLRIILTAVNSVQQAYIAKKMIFRKFFFATLLGTVLSAVIGICMAYAGFGVWALVAQYLVSTGVSTAVLLVTLRQRPRLLILRIMTKAGISQI